MRFRVVDGYALQSPREVGAEGVAGGDGEAAVGRSWLSDGSRVQVVWTRWCSLGRTPTRFRTVGDRAFGMPREEVVLDGYGGV